MTSAALTVLICFLSYKLRITKQERNQYKNTLLMNQNERNRNETTTN